MERTADAYRILQVDPTAELIVIQAAYRALARRHHPDGDAPDAERMAAINRAYAVLRNPETRRKLDMERSMVRTQAVPLPTVQRRVDAWVPRNRSMPDRSVIDFGRYAGWRIADLARHDPDYLRWLCRHSSGLRFREAITSILPPEPDLERRANSVA